MYLTTYLSLLLPAKLHNTASQLTQCLSVYTNTSFTVQNNTEARLLAQSPNTVLAGTF